MTDGNTLAHGRAVIGELRMLLRRVGYACLVMLVLLLAYNFGIRSAKAGSSVVMPTEVAVLSGTVQHGETIPLPVYGDGTQALESECQWMVSPHEMGSLTWTYPIYRRQECSTQGRVVTCYVQSQDANGTYPILPGTANYLIIATRGAGLPTGNRTQSFGALKARYR